MTEMTNNNFDDELEEEVNARRLEKTFKD